jgi:predicted esterase
MITPHGVKVLDFGLAKILSDPGTTEPNAIMGTPAYMAPEQVEGREPTSRTDLFALGLVVYEMSVGRLPFPGVSLGRMLSSGAQTVVPQPSRERTGLPAVFDGLVAKLLEKDSARRPQSASEVARELSALADGFAAPPPRSRWRPVAIIPAIVALLIIAAGGAWFYHRSEQRHWVREHAIPEISQLASKQPLAAFRLLGRAEEILPGDAQVAQIAQSSTQLTSVDSLPAGAQVEIQDYISPGAWFSLGTTPLTSARIPNGYFRWRISRPGAGEFIAAPATFQHMHFQLRSQGTAPGMVPVPGYNFADMIDFIGALHYKIPPFDIDQFEVTNAQFQKFVDRGGYRRPEFWKEKFIKDGQDLTWRQAMDLFRDPTGRSAPSTWAGGHFPPGQENYPVSGVSWYEAAAYAVFAGKSLPTIGQWYTVAPSDFSVYSVSQSNFNGRGPAPVGTYQGVGPFGTYDMAGNVREWVWNAVENNRFVLGGAWLTQTYQAFDPEALPAFDRSALNGFRCVRNKGPLTPDLLAPVSINSRDFAHARPVSDDVFAQIRTMYAYDHVPLGAVSQGVVENTADWTREKITIDAGHENERLPVYLFLPRNVRSPYQTVLFFPSARVALMPSSQVLGDLQFVDYVIQSGRALVYPIYTGSYERKEHLVAPGAFGDLEMVTRDSKEIGRSLDYLETRPDIDKSKIAYLGVSWGSAYGVIFTALEDRFKTVVFLDGGFFLRPTLPARDQVNFAPRLKKPVLMVNGRYDFTFSPERAQEPLYRMLGTSAADKRRVVFDTPHDISQNKPELSKEVLAWLDKYLGKVN